MYPGKRIANIRASLAVIALLALIGLLAGCGGATGGGQGGGGGGGEYPVDEIEFIVPYDPGGGYDSWARLLAPFLEKHLPGDVSVVVRNEPGAGGLTAANRMYAAKPDGSQIQIMNVNGLAAGQLAGQTDFELEKFTYLGTVTTDPYVLTVAGDSKINNIEDLKAAAPIKQAITGFTSGDGVATVVLYDTFGIEYTPVLHEGSSDARLSVIRGDTQVSVYPLESILGDLQSGDLKPILYVGEPVAEDAPGYEKIKDVQTVEELGYPELNNLEAPRAIGAPPELPEETKQALDKAIQDSLKDPELLEKAKESELTPHPLDAEETAELVSDALDTLSEYREALTEALKEG